MRLEHMQEFLKPNDQVLEFACATGRLALDIAPSVANVFGIDTSEGMIARANAKLSDSMAPNVEFRAIGLFDAELDERHFTVVTAFNVFHLLDDPRRYLRRMRELLTPGGLLIAETPCLGRKPWYIRSAIKLVTLTPFLPRARIFTANELEGLVAGEGFEIVESRLLDEEIGDPWIVARKPESGAG